MTDRKPLVAIDGRVYQQPYTSNLSVPGNVVLDYGNVDVNGRALSRWGVPQRDRCAASWSVRTSAADTQWRSVCWAPELGLFCAVSSLSGSVMTSPDGVTWTLRAGASSNTWFSVCWAPELGLFCAVATSGTGNRVMTSPDGVTWTTRTSAADNDWRAVCWAPELGLFCAVAASGTGNRVMTSPDGITWTIQTSAGDSSWWSVCRAPEIGLFCAVALSGTIMTSPDGITWTSRTSAASNQWSSVCWASEIGLFCTVSQNGTGNRVMTSPDGITWTTRTSPVDNGWHGACWAPELGLFCAVAISGTGNRVMCSLPAQPAVFSSTNAVYFLSIGTTASAANGFLNSASVPTNNLLRSTSSLRYKTDIEDLDPAHADAVLQLRPVWYRSLAAADKPEWSWYGLIAEEVATVEPRLVHYANDGEGNPIPDGVQYDRLGVLMLDVMQRDRAKLADLDARLVALEDAATKP